MTTYFLRRQTLAATVREPACSPGRFILRCGAVTLATLVPLIAAGFATRRIVGALASEFDDLTCATATLAFALAAVATRGELLNCNSAPSLRRGRFILFAPSVSWGLLLVAAWGRMPPGVALLAAAIVVTVEALTWRRLTGNGRRGAFDVGSARTSTDNGQSSVQRVVESTNNLAPPVQIAPSEFEAAELDDESEEDESLDFPPEATQRLLRSTLEGRDSLHGLGRVAFAAQQTHASLHIAFCPPFAQAPQIEAAAIEGPEAQVTAALVEPFGARIDVRLARASAQPDSVVIEFVATLGE